jgi:hypothetical protein
MPERIIYQGPGFTVAVSDELHSMTHYGSADRGDGNFNYGFVDLRDRPDLVDTIPEVNKSVSLGNLLRSINARNSPLMSFGCECAEFPLEATYPTGETIQVGGYIDVTFRDPNKNQTESALIDVARAILSRIPAPTEGIAINFEMIVQPLKLFFGAAGHFALMIKPLGYGTTTGDAWKAFEYATAAVETSIRVQLEEAVAARRQT